MALLEVCPAGREDVDASRCDASRAITFDREIRGFRPLSERVLAGVVGDVGFSLEGGTTPSSLTSTGVTERFLIGVGIPD